MQVVQMKPSDLIPYEKNHKKHPKTQIDKLVKQISAHGFDVPIVIDEKNIIIKGHARLAACKKLKLKTVPCIVRTDLNEEQKRAARIADNRLGELAELDLDALNAEMEHLHQMNFDVELTGFDNWEMKKDEEFVPDLPTEGDKEISNSYKLIVLCDDESSQQDLFEDLKSQGYKVKAG